VEKVHKISIVPRGRALGYTLNLPEEDRYLKSKEELTEYLVVLLGGRVAEQIVFGSVTTGASDDLKKVNEISRAMVAEYGMGNSMSSRRLAIDEYQISDNTRRLVDDEQADITDVAYRHAHRLIEEHRDKLEEFAVTLLQQEVLERDDIERIMGTQRAAPLEAMEPGPAQIAAAEPPQ
jgi:cell division protease FtsH